MDLVSLRLVLRISQLGGLGVAARDLGLSAATASARLAALEDEIGVRLFHRTTRAISLTEDGAAFLPHVESALELLNEGLATAKGRGLDPQGKLRMTAPGSFARMHIVPALAEFCDRYPHVELDLRLSDEVLDVIEGAFDLIVRNAELADSSLIARKLADDHRQLVASPQYLAKHEPLKTPQDLIHHACIVIGSQNRWQFQDGTTVTVPVRIRVNDGEAARIAAEAGLGITIKSDWNAYAALRARRLVPVLKDYPLQTRQALWVAYPAARVVPAKVRVMIDFLVDRFQPVVPWDVS